MRGAAQIMLLLAIGACGGDQQDEAATLPPTNAPPPTLNAAPGTFTMNDFAQLRFLEGTWRGEVPNGDSFYETYRFVDDSTIAMQGFKDAALTQKSDSATVEFRGGQIIDRGGNDWNVSVIDSAGFHFVSQGNQFVWKRTTEGWDATVGAGARAVTYHMKPHRAAQ